MHSTTKRRLVAAIALASTATLIAPTAAGAAEVEQIGVFGIDTFSSAPQPAFTNFDWKQRAEAFDDFAYDWTDRGVYSTIRVDETALNMPAGQKTYKMPAYYGDRRVFDHDGTNGDGYQESVTQLASVISATLVGIDKSAQTCNQPANAAQTCNYVDMLQTFYRGSTTGVAGNTPRPGGPGVPGTLDGWYQFLPNVLYSIIGEQYPDAQNMDTIQRGIADKFTDMVNQLGGANANFDMWDYNFQTMSKYYRNNDPNDTRYQTTELATATAFVLLNAYERFGDADYLQGAKWAMDSIERAYDNTYYEMINLLQPYVAARMNALYGTNYDVKKGFRWLMEGSKPRGGWGTLGGKSTAPVTWGDKSVSGLSGSLTDYGPNGGTPGNPNDSRTPGYVFAMNSFASTWLAATAKYDTQYANLVGKWLLNVNSASRYFFADQLAANEQWYGTDFIDGVSTGQSGSSAGWGTDDRAKAIAYESLQSRSGGLRALSDVPQRSTNWGVGADAKGLGMYGSAWIGFMSVIHPTNVANVLRIDLNKLDTYGENTYPTSLIYNPTGQAQQIQVPVTGSAKGLYDTISQTFLATNVTGNGTVTVPANASVVVVELPAGATFTMDGVKTLANGSPIAYDVSDRGDIAEGKTVTASPADAAVAAAVDGDSTTAFSSTQSVNRTVVVDTGAPRELAKVTLGWGARHPQSYALETSVDGVSWTSATSPIASLGGNETVTFAARTARYVRLSVPAAAGAFDLRTFEVYIADLARHKPVTVSATAASVVNRADGLNDGSIGTRWESASNDNQWAYIDLGTSQAVGKVRLDWEGAYGKDYNIQVSDDAQTWTTVGTRTNNAGAGIDTVTLNAGAKGRYVRWQGIARGTSWAYSLWSMEVLGAEGVTRTGHANLEPISVTPGGQYPITGSGYAPGETVVVTLDGETVATVTADGDGAFSTTVTLPIAVGTYEILVTGSISGPGQPVSVTVALAPASTTTTTLSLTRPSLAADASPTSIATINVTSQDGTTPTGIVTLASSGGTAIGNASLVGGKASITVTSALAVGSHNLVASYVSSDAATWENSSSAAAQLTITKAPVTVRATAAKIRVGQRPTVRVTVTTPGKWISQSVWVGLSATNGQLVRVPASGTASVRLPAVKSAGNHKIQVTVPTSTRLANASRTVTLKVTKAATKTKVTAAKRVKVGKRARVAIRVSAAKATGSKAGRARIYVNGKRRGTVKVKANGRSVVQVRLTKVGVNRVQVRYRGNKNLVKSQRTVKVRALR